LSAARPKRSVERLTLLTSSRGHLKRPGPFPTRPRKLRLGARAQRAADTTTKIFRSRHAGFSGVLPSIIGGGVIHPLQTEHRCSRKRESRLGGVSNRPRLAQPLRRGPGLSHPLSRPNEIPCVSTSVRIASVRTPILGGSMYVSPVG